MLADEINRAPAKVQSALLEAMQERQVTIGEQTFKLEEPFLVLATQNPIEQEGTYPLPEAQVDRFMLKLKIGYPSRAEERQILDLMARTSGTPKPTPVVEPAEILKARQVINDIYVDDKVKDYIVDLVCATREPEAHKIQVKDFIQLGASPRATISSDPGRQGLRFPARPRLCDSAGRQKHRHGRPAPPRGHHLRGRSGRKNQRDGHSEDLRRIAGAVSRGRDPLEPTVQAGPISRNRTLASSKVRVMTTSHSNDSSRDSQKNSPDRDPDQPAGERDAWRASITASSKARG